MKNKYIRIVLSIILFLIAEFIKFNNEYITIGVFLLSYGCVAIDVLIEAIEGIKDREFFDENFLMSIATIGALSIKQYPEAIAVMLLYQVGEILEDKSIEKSKRSITSLLKIRPEI